MCYTHCNNLFTDCYYLDEISKLDVVLNSMGELMLKAPNTFSGYILPSVGCSALGCGGSVTVRLSTCYKIIV